MILDAKKIAREAAREGIKKFTRLNGFHSKLNVIELIIQTGIDPTFAAGQMRALFKKYPSEAESLDHLAELMRSQIGRDSSLSETNTNNLSPELAAAILAHSMSLDSI